MNAAKRNDHEYMSSVMWKGDITVTLKAFDTVCLNGEYESVKFFMKALDVHHQPRYLITEPRFELACRSGNMRLVRYFMTHIRTFEYTDIFWKYGIQGAIEGRHLRIYNMLITYKVDNGLTVAWNDIFRNAYSRKRYDIIGFCWDTIHPPIFGFVYPLLYNLWAKSSIEEKILVYRNVTSLKIRDIFTESPSVYRYSVSSMRLGFYQALPLDNHLINLILDDYNGQFT